MINDRWMIFYEKGGEEMLDPYMNMIFRPSGLLLRHQKNPDFRLCADGTIDLGVLTLRGDVYVNDEDWYVLCRSSLVGLDFAVSDGTKVHFWMVPSSTSPFELKGTSYTDNTPEWHYHGVEPDRDRGFFEILRKWLKGKWVNGRYEFQWEIVEEGKPCK